LTSADVVVANGAPDQLLVIKSNFSRPEAGIGVAIKLKGTQLTSIEWSGIKQPNVDAV
jgi:hypothetical protein